MTGTLLPDAQWRRDPALLAVLDALGGDPAVTLAVGGAVRDTLARLPVSDVDLATHLRPDDVVTRLKAAGLKAIPTGIGHGTVTAVADGRPFEVTTLRRDVATDGRRATVTFADDWAEDAARRDFTINALYADPVGGAVIDPVGGIADLAAGRVRFIGDAGQRIDEDHLRILRWFRFLARFGEAPDAATLAAIAQKAPKLRALSRERIAGELLRILALDDPGPIAGLMERTGVLGEIMPEALPGAAARVGMLVESEKRAGMPGDAVRRLIALLPVDATAAHAVAGRLKLSNRIRKRIATARGRSGDGAPRPLAYRLGREGAVDHLLLAGDDTRPALAELDGWQIPRLPVGGGDLVALGLAQGPEVARLLREVEQAWIAEGFPGRDRTLELARERMPAG